MNLPKRMLGNSGLETSLLALGTVKLGRDQGVKYPVKIPTDQEARRLLAEAASLGINLIDTAPAYGESEARLGQLLRTERQRWLLCTKVGENFSAGVSSYDFTPEATRASVERSLQLLATDYLDIVLIHSDGNDTDILQNHGTLQMLETLKAEGKIRAVGISHKTIAGAELAMAQGADVLMATLNTEHTAEAAVIAAAGAKGIGVLIKKALASGQGQTSDLAWVAVHAGVSSIVVGTTSPAHLSDNVAAVSSVSGST